MNQKVKNKKKPIDSNFEISVIIRQNSNDTFTSITNITFKNVVITRSPNSLSTDLPF